MRNMLVLLGDYIVVGGGCPFSCIVKGFVCHCGCDYIFYSSQVNIMPQPADRLWLAWA